MTFRMAFIGFRHPHINGLYKLAVEHPDIEVVGVCEEDAASRAALAAAGIPITHESYAQMLDEAACDIVACGDYNQIRAERLCAALERGCHVIGDKPLCIRLEELDRIQRLAQERRRCVGCMLDLVDHGPYRALREVIQRGRIGEVHAINFQGQHPLRYGQRPMWYFEPGKHGGTLNDILIHAVDAIPWLTGRRIVEITAARAWNARLKQHPQFQDGATAMLRLDNDGAATGDVSYLSSDRHSFAMAPYWRFTLWGAEGVAETSAIASHVTVWRSDTDGVIQEPAAPPRTGGYFEDFLHEIAGQPNPDGLHSQRVFESTRIALLAQQAADTGRFPMAVVR